MADDGFRPEIGIQFATDTQMRLVVGVAARIRALKPRKGGAYALSPGAGVDFHSLQAREVPQGDGAHAVAQRILSVAGVDDP